MLFANLLHAYNFIFFFPADCDGAFLHRLPAGNISILSKSNQAGRQNIIDRELCLTARATDELFSKSAVTRIFLFQEKKEGVSY